MNEQRKVKNPKGMLLMTGIVIILVLYLEWKVIHAYLLGGEGAPSLALVIISSIVMVAGCVLIGWLAIRLYKQSKEADDGVIEAEVVPTEEEEPAIEETASEEPQEEPQKEEKDDPEL